MRIGLRWPSWLRRSRPAPPPPKPEPVKPPTPSPVDAHRGQSTFEPGKPMRVNLVNAQGFTPAERQKLEQAARLVEQVLSSPEFRDAVLNKTHNGKRQFADNGGMSNEQIYQAILEAKESYAPEADGELDLHLNLRNFSFWQRNVVGYTYENTPQITMNRRFFSQYTPAEIAGNMVHEWLHKLGFDHDFHATAHRPDSVPYAVGDLVEKLASGIRV